MECLFAEEFEFILTSLLQISDRTTFFQYRSVSDGRFLVSLTEVCTSEKNLACRSLLKVGDNYYWMQEEPEHTGEGDYVDAFVQKLELDESAIMEASLCDNSEFVAFITKKFQIENYMPIMLYSDDLHNEHSVSREEVYLDRCSLTRWLITLQMNFQIFVFSIC